VDDVRGNAVVGAPRRIGLVSVHTSPLEQPGAGDSGGMNVYLSKLAAQLVAAGAAVEVFTRTCSVDLPRTITAPEGYRVHHVDAGPPRLSKSDLASHLCAFYLGMAAHPVAGDLELLHGHYWMSGWVGRQARRRLGIPLVQSFHTLGHAKNDTLAPGDTREPSLRLAAEERVVADADAIISPTPFEQTQLVRRYKALPRRVHVVEPGVDLATFRTDIDRHAARRSLGGGRIVLFVGRLQPLKGPDFAIRTLAALDQRLPDDGVPTRLVMGGGTSGNGVGTTDPVTLRRLAATLGVADRVAVLAPRPQDDLALLYRADDAVIVPSHSESFGLVALEAQACGTPVVAADVSGLRHVLGQSGGGTLVSDHEPEAFATALLRYLSDSRLRAAAGEAGARHAAGYGWERTAAGTLAVYADVLARARDVTPDQRRDRQGA
jgi:D-inositol-3-phosphate glycosyltransferase